MDTIKRWKLQKHREAIVQDLDVREIDIHLLGDGVLAVDELEKIQKETSRKDQARHLLDILPSKGPPAFDIFMKSLNESYPWLAEKLAAPWSYDANVSEEEEKTLSDAMVLGGLPHDPPYNVDRTGKLEELRKSLTDLKRGHYVVLHGMAGSGKSSLAARTLGDTKLLIESFKACVYWLGVGDVNSDNLFSPMCQLLDMIPLDSKNPWNCNPTTVDQAKQALRKAMLSEKVRDGLLILDDVTSSDLIAAFDVGCKVLVTTKDLNCMKKVKGRDRHIGLIEGFKLEESLALFAKCVGIPVKDLPHQASKIHILCKGVPMVIALIGAQLAENKDDVKRNSGRWDSYLDKLANRAYGNIHHSVNVELSQDGLFGAIGMSIENLPSHLRILYNDFALFVEDVNIKPEVLETVWGYNKYEVEDLMEEFVKRSLAVHKWNDQLNSSVYGIHDLLLYYLKQQMSDAENQALHKKLLNCYHKVCNNRFCDLPTNDNYIFSYIGYHITQAQQWHSYKSLYFDLEFLGAKLRVSGLGDLLVDYRKYKEYITDKNPVSQEMFEDFDKFVQSHGLDLFQYPELDIVQCALQQPRRSHVYKEALRLANERTSRLYFEFLLDQDSASQPSTFHVRQGVLAACFTIDSNRILLAYSGEGHIHLWDMDYGRILYTFYGHTKQVFYLELNQAKEMQFLSASEDGSVKLWSLENILYQDKSSSQIYDQNGFPLKTPSPRMRQDSWSSMFGNGDQKANNAVRTFAHEESVRHATFSHDGTLVLSCGDSVKIWNCLSGKCVLQIAILEEATACAFSSDDSSVLFAMNNSIFIHSSDNGDFISSLCSLGNTIRILPLPECDSHVIVACREVVHLCSLKDLSRIPICRCEGGNYICAALSQDGEFVIVSSSDHKIAVWKIGDNTLVQEYEDNGLVYVLDTYLSEVMQLLLWGSDNCTIKVWFLSPQLENKITSKLQPEFHASWCSHSKSFPILAAPDNKKVQVWQGRKFLLETVEEKCPVKCCRLAIDGKLLVYGCEDGSVKVLDINGFVTTDRSPNMDRPREVPSKPLIGECVLKFDEPVHYLRFVDYCGSRSLVAASEKAMQVWSEDRGKFVKTRLSKLVHCFSCDHGCKLLACCQDSSIHLWSGNGSSSMVVASGSDNHITSADNAGFSIVMGDAGAKLHLVILNEKYSSPTTLKSIPIASAVIRSVRFSPDAKVIALGCDSGTILVWDVKKEKIITTLNAHKSWVRELSFSPWSPRVLISVGDLLAFWDVSSVCVQGRRRSTTKPRLTFEPLDISNNTSIWCTKRGNPSKPELLGCVKLVGQYATHVEPSPDFSVFTCIDAGGTVYYLKVFYGSQQQAHKLTLQELRQRRKELL